MSLDPFDPIAEEYDAQFTDTRVGQMQRDRVYYFLKALLEKEAIQQVLELNCGTGADAYWMAQKGCEVLATDRSPEMVQTARSKNRTGGDQRNPRFKVCSFLDLNQLETDSTFDLIFSNFGGLNCLAPSDIPPFSEMVGNQLKPGGFFAMVIMGRFCLWETLYFLLKGNRTKAWRRLSKDAVAAPLGAGLYVDTWYYRPTEFAQAFQSDFDLQAIRPIGMVLPPSYLDPLFKRVPRSLTWLYRIEALFGNQSWGARFSDHYWMVLQKRK